MAKAYVKVTNFNPRLREGGDDMDLLSFKDKDNFNPRLREGGDFT